MCQDRLFALRAICRRRHSSENAANAWEGSGLTLRRINIFRNTSLGDDGLTSRISHFVVNMVLRTKRQFCLHPEGRERKLARGERVKRATPGLYVAMLLAPLRGAGSRRNDGPGVARFALNPWLTSSHPFRVYGNVQTPGPNDSSASSTRNLPLCRVRLHKRSYWTQFPEMRRRDPGPPTARFEPSHPA